MIYTRVYVFGVADGARTHDNRNHNPGLYQLSYSHRNEKLLARPTGIEPVTARLEGGCSIRLSYGRVAVSRLIYRAIGLLAGKLVGAVGFELTTPCSQNRCANQTALRPDEKAELYRLCLLPSSPDVG